MTTTSIEVTMNVPVNPEGLKRRPAAPGPRRFSRIIGLLAAALVLQACSAMKLAYNQVPEIAYLYLDGYVDFNGVQSLKVKEELGKVHQWHRQTQLPAYIDSLKKLQAQMPGEMEPQAACAVFADVRSKMVALTERTEPAVVSIVGMLEPAQLRHMEKKFDKINAEYRSDYLEGNPRNLRDKRMKLVVKRAEMLYGSLDAKQLAVIGKNIDDSVFDARKAYAERLRSQRDAVQTLTPLIAGQAPQDKVQASMRQLLDRTLNPPDAAYRAYIDNFMRDNCQAFAELHNSTTPVQRRKALETLKRYEEDFRILSTQPS
jgi:Family of unknown function (DUF6279)